MQYVSFVKIFFALALLYSALEQIINFQTWWFIQNVNLIFHEAGHIIFMFFGESLHILGGSILETLVPTLVTIHFVHTKQIFSAGVASWWMSTAFLSVSIYASDAQERSLNLITNDISTHDWHNLLSKFGLLKYDDWFGYAFLIGALLSVTLMVYFFTQDTDIKKLIYKK